MSRYAEAASGKRALCFRQGILVLVDRVLELRAVIECLIAQVITLGQEPLGQRDLDRMLATPLASARDILTKQGNNNRSRKRARSVFSRSVGDSLARLEHELLVLIKSRVAQTALESFDAVARDPDRLQAPAFRGLMHDGVE